LKAATVEPKPIPEAKSAPVEAATNPLTTPPVLAEVPSGGTWDPNRAAQAIAEVDRLIDAALAAGDVANTPSRRRILEDDKAIVRSRAHEQDPIVWGWPASVGALLARWQQDDGQGSRVKSANGKGPALKQ
jgi:hypothetical protein